MLNETLLALAGALGAAVYKLTSLVYERRKGNGFTVEDRVKSLEERMHRQANATQGLVARAAVTEANLANLKENVARIADTVDRMDSKLDRALGRR